MKISRNDATTVEGISNGTNEEERYGYCGEGPQ